MYPLLHKWAEHFGSPRSLSEALLRAQATNAPQDAIYEIKSPTGHLSGLWKTVQDVTDEYILGKLGVEKPA